MRTTPRSFYQLFVLPNLDDYLGAPDDARLGFNAALSAFQLADIFHAFYTREDPSIIAQWKKLAGLHRHLGSIEPCYLTVQSLATVYKHLYAIGGHYEVGTPGAVWGVSIPRAKIGLQSEWGDEARPLGDVMVKRLNGDTVSLTDALSRVVNEMWPNFLPEEQA
ncbi:hypothetical protein NKI12_08055 [Mesorhizobium australicum]|uniref:Uncharacterized protein n=1 Tax=Mesorhizobium australicum TaxID=536018 RepID=A0ACC6SU12_9HYPH